MNHYFSVLIPFVLKDPSRWHPRTSVGPFSTLSRGAFSTEAKAHAWAQHNLEGHPYEVKRYGDDVEPTSEVCDVGFGSCSCDDT
jgi:hypothetical protein